MALKPVLYLTSEIANRDWDTRLLMADFATAAGFSAVIGQQWSAHENFSILPKGLLLAKTLNEIQVDAMRTYRRKGHLVAAMDEESFAIAPDQQFLGFVAKDLSDCCDIFFPNTLLHAQALVATRPALAKVMGAPGNPRTDLVGERGRRRLQKHADAIRDKVGRFVLFNTNMAQGNSIFANEDDYLAGQIQAGTLDPADEASVAIFRGQFAFESANVKALEAVIRWCIAHLPSHAIAIRPHPAERKEYWEKFAAESPRIVLAFDTPHLPWMLASDLVVHTNSTTGMEAAMMGKPTLNLVPLADEFWSTLYMTRRVSPTFHDVDQATAAISDLLNHGTGRLSEREPEQDQIRRYFANFESSLVSERMVADMIALMKRRGVDRKPFSFLKAVVGKYQLFTRSEFRLRKFQKSFPQAMADLKELRAVSGLRHPVVLTQLDDSIFVMAPEKALPIV